MFSWASSCFIRSRLCILYHEIHRFGCISSRLSLSHIYTIIMMSHERYSSSSHRTLDRFGRITAQHLKFTSLDNWGVFSYDLVKSRNHEIGTLNCRIALKFDRHIKFQSDRTILNTNLAASRFYEILRKDVFSGIETGLNWKERTCVSAISTMHWHPLWLHLPLS